MERIRILLAEMPPILHEIIRDVLASQPDMEVVGGMVSARRLIPAAARRRADVIIMALEPPEVLEVCSAVLYARPTVSVVTIANGGRDAFLHELRPQLVPMGNVSPDALVNAIRARARPANPASPARRGEGNGDG